MRVAFLPCAQFFLFRRRKKASSLSAGSLYKTNKKSFIPFCVSVANGPILGDVPFVGWMKMLISLSLREIDTVSQSFLGANKLSGESRRSEKADLFTELELLGKRRQRRRFFWVQARWALVLFPVLCASVLRSYEQWWYVVSPQTCPWWSWAELHFLTGTWRVITPLYNLVFIQSITLPQFVFRHCPSVLIYVRQLDLRTLWRFHPYHTWIFRNDGWKVLTDDPDSSVQIRSIPMTKAFDEGVKKASG